MSWVSLRCRKLGCQRLDGLCCAVLCRAVPCLPCRAVLGWAVLCCVGLALVMVMPLHVILFLFFAILCCTVLTLALLSSARLAANIQRTQG